MISLTGRLTSLVTPFTDDGSALSEVRLVRLLRFFADSQGFTLASDAGEFTTVSGSERKQLLEIVLREVGGKPVVVHATRQGTAQTLDLAQHAARHGARAALVMPPYYGAFSAKEVSDHLRTIAKYAGLPILVVDPQSRIDADVLEGLRDVPDLTLCQGNSAIWTCGELSSGLGAPELDRLGSEHDPAAVAKAYLSLRDVEVGRPRPPRAPLGGAALEQIRLLG